MEGRNISVFDVQLQFQYRIFSRSNEIGFGMIREGVINSLVIKEEEYSENRKFGKHSSANIPCLFVSLGDSL